MSSTSRRAQGPVYSPGSLVLTAVSGAGLLLALTVLGAAELAARLDGEHVPGDPFQFVGDLIRGTAAWPAHASAIAVVAALLVAAVSVRAGLWFRRRVWLEDGHVDRAAKWMGKGRQIETLSHAYVARKAEAFGVQSAGLPFGRSVQDGSILYADYEAVQVIIAGPRVGKTTCHAVPANANAPGIVVNTSNKSDLYDFTVELRAQRGTCWRFDPQFIVEEPQSFYYNPLSYVADERTAMELADVFATSSRPAGGKEDAFFDVHGQGLVADLLLAAALDRRYLPQVLLWLSDEQDREPIRILREHGFTAMAADAQSKYGAADKQRSGVFGSALRDCEFMKNSRVMEWVTPPSQWPRRPDRMVPVSLPQFSPDDFVRSCNGEGTGDTLYSLSKEGKAGAGPVVAALTVHVCEAAEELAKTLYRGRLAVPMVVVGDEAANVVRWRQLPDKYSHYGSRGILILTYLQSWSQGETAWGKDGMAKMWSAANVKVYLGNVSEVEFLKNVKELVGDFDLYSRSLTAGNGETIQRSSHRAAILEVSDLASLPPGRMIVMAAGAKPTLAATIHWSELDRDTVELIRHSDALHNPKGTGADPHGEQAA